MARARRRRRFRWKLPKLKLTLKPVHFKAAALILTPIAAINLAVAFFGQTVVFPLSPFFLGDKCHALAAYAQHRVVCLWTGHPPLPPLIAAAENRYRLPPGLLAALISVESEGKVHRISSAGAMGPAQLMDGTAEYLGVTDPFDSKDAIDGAARYLAEHQRRRRNLSLAVASYNAGPGNVGSSVPHNGETEFYVAKVLAEYERLRPVGKGRLRR